jgi:3-oxoacyl-[acyl-carrier-protein] synthase-3
MKLDGLKIFNFALREVAPNINLLIETYNLKGEDIDAYVFHQANLLMLESVRKKIKVDKEKVPYSLFNFGNTSSASIPVTIATQLRQKVSSQPMILLLSGFGVGLSWGSCVVKTNNVCCPELVEI